MRSPHPKKKLSRLGIGSFCTGFAVVDISMNVAPQEEEKEIVDYCFKELVHSFVVSCLWHILFVIAALQLCLEGENNNSMVKLAATSNVR